jgi:hypothetical protein
MRPVEMTRMADGLHWHPHALVEKYSADQVAYTARRCGLAEPHGALLRAWSGAPDLGTAEADGNLLVTVGLTLITQLIIGTTTAGSFKNAQAILGVGNSATAAAVGNTALTTDGTANAWYMQCDSGSNPSQSSGVITAVATFPTGQANFAWNEWMAATTTAGTITAGTTLSGLSSGTETALNHAVQSLGTKTSAAAWVLTATITLS